MAKRITHRRINSQSFEWEVTDYNAKSKEYTLKNKATGQMRTITKERYMELLKEQERKAWENLSI